MQLLAIETCFGKFSIALFIDGVNKAYFASKEDTKQAEQLIPEIERLLKNNDTEYKNLGAVAVATGPGSFTGLRIGLAAAKGFALALGIKLIGVTTLEAVIHRKKGGSARLDASRGDSFYQESAAALPELVPYEGVFDEPPTAIEIGEVALKRINEPQKDVTPVYVRKVDTKLPHTIRLSKMHALCFPKGWEPNMFEGLEYIERPEGFVAYKTVLGECEIKTICVLPQHRRKGIAQSLMKQIKAQNIFLEVEENNLAAINLYKKLGFSEFNRRKDYYGTGRNALLMRLQT